MPHTYIRNRSEKALAASNVFDRALNDLKEQQLKNVATLEQWARYQQYNRLLAMTQPDPLPVLLEAASYSQRTTSKSGAVDEMMAGGGVVMILAIAAPEVLLAGAALLVLTQCGSQGSGTIHAGDPDGSDNLELSADVYVEADSIQSADWVREQDINSSDIDVQAADNVPDQVADNVPDQIYDPAYKNCFLFPPVFPRTPDPEELTKVMEYGGDDFNNFYKEIRIYYPPELSEYDAESLADGVNTAAGFVQLLTGKFYKMPPRYDILEIYFRYPETIEDEGHSGTANGNQIWLNRHIFEKNLTTGDVQALSATTVHEMMHTYVQPSLAEDANNICNEGNAELSERAFLAHPGAYGAKSGYGLFPDEPIQPLFAAKFEDGLDKNFVDDNGLDHNIKMKAFEAGDGLVFIDGEVHYAADGACEYFTMDDFFICNDTKDGIDNMLVFNRSDIVTDDVAEMPYEDNGEEWLKIYDGVECIWGLDINGVPGMFRSPLGSYSSWSFHLSQEPSDEKSGLEYRAAYGLLLLLQQMYRDSHPAAQPNQFLSIIGGVYNAYVEENCENGYHLPTTNIYHRICENMDVDVNQCLDIFESFGLNVNWFLE